MNALSRLAALFALMAGCAIGAPRAAGSGAAAAPVPVDSLMTESLLHARLAAPDLTQLSWLRRQADLAAKEFGRYLGNEPPLITIASVVSLPEARRPSVAALRVAGYEYVLAEPTDRPGVPPPVTPDAALAWASPGSERISRWYLRAFVRKKATGTPPPGKTSPIPDWYESAIAGLAMLPLEQNLRLAWMHARMDQRIPMEQFLAMSRPEATAKPGKTAKGAVVYSQRLFDAQALSFARFICLAERNRFMGDVLERSMTGESQLYAFNIAKRLLPRPDALEKDWVAWVAAGAGKFEPR